jgi:hypothetical protein
MRGCMETMPQNVQQRRDELARLRALEREIMLKLGLRPPGRLGMFFGQHPFSMSAAIGLLLVSFASLTTFFVLGWINDQQAQALVARPASE